MFERFSTDARVVVIGAQSHARRLGHRPIGTEHLLRAMLDDDTRTTTALRAAGLTAAGVESAIHAERAPDREADRRALASIGIDLDAVLASVGDELPDLTHQRARGRRRRGTRQAPAGHLPFSRSAKTSLELALREAVRLRSRRITTDHVLLGVLREGSGLACRIVVDQGVSTTELRRHVEDGVRRSA